MTDHSRLKSTLWKIAALGAGVRLILLLLPRSFLVTYRLPDDAMYYFAIARNIVLGNGVSYDGVDPANGFHPLWLALITPLWLIGGDHWDPIYATLILQSVLDGLCVIATAWAAYGATIKLDEQRRQFAALASATIVAFNPVQIIRGINGLETSLTSLLLLTWIWYYFKVLYEGGNPGRLFFLTCILFLARTDSVIIILPALLPLAREYRSLLRRRHYGWLEAGVGVALVLFWLQWNYYTFGNIIQSSGEAVALFAHTKFAIIHTTVLDTIRHLTEEATRNTLKPFYASTGGVGLAVLLWVMFRRRSWNMGLVPILWLIAGGLLLLTFHSIVRGFIRDWYVIQLIGLFAVTSAATFAMLEEGRRLALWLTLSVLFGIWIVEFSRPRLESQAFWLDPIVERSLVADSMTIGAFNSGYLAYVQEPTSGTRVVNLDGVVNGTAVDYLRERRFSRYVDSMRIDRIVDFQGTLSGYRNLFEPELTSNFTLSRQFPVGTEILEIWDRKVLAK